MNFSGCARAASGYFQKLYIGLEYDPCHWTDIQEAFAHRTGHASRLCLAPHLGTVEQLYLEIS